MERLHALDAEFLHLEDRRNPLLGTLTRLITRVMRQLPQRSVNSIITNVPGPNVPLYCLGRQMLTTYPYVPIFQGMRLGTAILSYHGNFGLGFTADRDSTLDITVVAQAVELAARWSSGATVRSWWLRSMPPILRASALSHFT